MYQRSISLLSYFTILSFLFSSCSDPKIIQKPIPFDEERVQLSLEYLEKRHGLLQEEPSIVPKMVVVHYTVIPTLEKTFQAFHDSTLPGARAGIATASALNVSSQYVIDQDGSIYQLLPDTVFARHVIGLNHCAIGIENVGGGKDMPLTNAQLRSNIALLKKLINKYDIEYVIGHSEYQQFIGHPLWKETDPDYLTEKSDPGEVFMAKIRKKLKPFNLKPLPVTSITSKEIETIRQRLIQDALKNKGFLPTVERYIPPDFSKAAVYLQQLKPNGEWSDVDYKDRDNSWHPLHALNKMLVMAYAYSNKTDPLYQHKDLLAGITKALEYWYEVNPRCKNWYKNDIAKQFYFHIIALLLQDQLDDHLLQKMIADLTEKPSMTGSNKTLVSTSVFYRGVLEKNPDRIKNGIEGVLDQVEVTTKEGIQPDYSFHQHGPFIYNGSYGHNFLRETMWLASIVQGTSFAYSEEQMKILSDYYTEGTRWMIRGHLFDYNVRGRQVGRSTSFAHGADNIVPQLNNFIIADPANSAFYTSSRDLILKGKPQNIHGNRHFWRSDYTAHHRKDYFTSLKMCSQRTIGMEMDVNTENLYGYYLPFGLTYIYRHGDEYQKIFPVWDWARLPGVTSPHQEFSSDGKSTQQTTFVGGVSDGLYGVSAMDLNVKNTQAKKSWFWFDEEWVALGAGIQSSQEVPIVTGINQAHLNGDILVDGLPFVSGQKVLDHPSSVWHDSIAYIFPQKQKVTIKAEEQAESLQKIFGLAPDTVYRFDVFSLWFDHGIQPQGGDYEYIVVPAIGSKRTVEYTKNVPITILYNTTKLQAVTQKALGITGMVFHEAGECTLNDNVKVIVDQPCIVLLNHKKKVGTVSDPTAGLKEINLVIHNGKNEPLAKRIILPSGPLAGSSVDFKADGN